MADNTIRITAFDLDETFEEAKVRDINLSSVNEKKAELISEWLDAIYEEWKMAGEKIDSSLKEKGISGSDEGLACLPDDRPSKAEDLISNQLLGANYLPPTEAVEIYWHLESLRSMYQANLPLEATCRLDVSAFKLLPKAVQLLEGVPEQIRTGVLGIVNAARGGRTKDKISEAFHKLGAVWGGNGICMEGKVVSLNFLARKIEAELKFEKTKEHITNNLKRLHKEGTI